MGMDYRLSFCLLEITLLWAGVNTASRFSDDQYEVHGEGTWETSLEICGQRAVKLTDLDHHNSLTFFLDKLRIPAVWLPSRRIVFNTYKWLDDSDVDTDVAKMGRQLTYSCGVLDIALGIYDFRPCETKGLSYLCGIKDCRRCSDLGLTSHDCMSRQNMCYVFSCGVGNWYQAKVKCVRMSGRLAVVKSEADMKLFMRLWKRDFLGPCSNSWLGLRLEEWTGLEDSSVALWSPNEPRQGLNCLLLQSNTDEYVWRAGNCSEEHRIVCKKSYDYAGKRMVKLPSTTMLSIMNATSQSVISKTVTTGLWTSVAKNQKSSCSKWDGPFFVIEVTLVVCVFLMILTVLMVIRNKKMQARRQNEDIHMKSEQRPLNNVMANEETT